MIEDQPRFNGVATLPCKVLVLKICTRKQSSGRRSAHAVKNATARLS